MADQKKDKKAPEYPDTPSGKALAAVGDLDGEDVKHDGYDDAAKSPADAVTAMMARI